MAKMHAYVLVDDENQQLLDSIARLGRISKAVMKTQGQVIKTARKRGIPEHKIREAVKSKK